ncbi:MAG: sugar porter family MFS transporter [Candidatus Thermoplasmatota archaeon]|nr:sugar porter family MFS transporter [Candidatus Thermoplasmatota archaeon]
MTEQTGKFSSFSAMDNVPTGRVHYRITALSAAGVFLDGYDISIIGVALTIISGLKDFSYVNTALGKGLMAASTTIGMLFGAIIFGYITDLRGRKFMYLWDMVIFIIFTALISFASFNFDSLFIFRLILGLAIGADYAISTTIISEFSPVKSRGKLLAVNVSAWWIGSAIAYTIGFLLLPLGTEAWRYMFAIGIVPAVIVLVFRFSVPESSRWLAQSGRVEESKKVERQISGNVDERKVAGRKTSIKELFSSQNIRATIFVSIFWFSYDVAFYGIGLFSPTILEIFGLSHSLSILGSAIFAFFAVIGSFLCIALIDRLGRKTITALGFAGMSVSLVILGIIALLVPKSAFSVGILAPVIVLMFIVFEVTQTIGPGGTDFVYPQEIYPTSIRATGQGFGTSVSRIGAILGLTAFPALVAFSGLGAGLMFFFAFSVIGLVVTLVLGVETKGKSLEELTR